MHQGRALWDGGGGLETHVRRDRGQQLFANRRKFGKATESAEDVTEDPVAGRESRYALADRLDNASDIRSKHPHAGFAHPVDADITGIAGLDLGVRGVQRHRVNAQQNLAFAWLWRWHVFDPQVLGRTVAVLNDRFHSTTTVWRSAPSLPKINIRRSSVITAKNPGP